MRCLRCNRVLRTVTSYERGYGHRCWMAVLKEARGEQLVLELDKSSQGLAQEEKKERTINEI